MSLPPIPDEALRAAHVALWEGDGDDHQDCAPDGEATAALEASWPHLYRTALRHAADIVDDCNGFASTGMLRRLADEAVTK
jgi:hypothetical protein